MWQKCVRYKDGKDSKKGIAEVLDLRELDENLKNANILWKTDIGYILHSGRRRIGKIIVLAKRAACKAARVFCGPLLERQIEFNALTVRCLNEIRKYMDTAVGLNGRIERLQEEFEAETIKNRRSKQIRTGVAYKKFEDQMRGTRKEIKNRLRTYQDVIKTVRESNGYQLFALDLGCGRGEWLELMQEWKIAALGVDRNESMINSCKKRRLDVIKNDLLTHIKYQSSDSVDILTAFQVVEHLHINTLTEVLKESYRILRPGGVLILETPNPENLIVGACNFYADPTHIQKIPPELLRTLVEDMGYVNVKVIRQHPYSAIDLSKADKNGANYELIAQMAVFFNNCADYAVVAYKRENGGPDENITM